ncbi:DEAD/DEAH box helicase [Nannocystaceae bacterium ST9]
MLNPITYTEKVVGDFLRYQLTTYPFADRDLHDQMRRLLNLEQTRNTPLLQGPFVSLSRAFARGSTISTLIADRVLHPDMRHLPSHEHVYGHQEQAFRAIGNGRTTLIATGTGSGKTECFLYPIISHCLNLRDARAPEGIVAVLVYPMNALAEDQLGRMRELLAGTGVSFGMYVGKTPEKENQVVGRRLAAGSTREGYRAVRDEVARKKDGRAVHPPEERVSREAMREPGKQPRILLTNVKQLELLLTRQHDADLFDHSNLRFLVFDEAHTFSGAQGAETACLIRRLRKFCGKRPDEVVCVATSATIADREDVGGGSDFATRFFGVDASTVTLVRESFEDDAWAAKPSVPEPLADPAGRLQALVEALREFESEAEGAPSERLLAELATITGRSFAAATWREQLYDCMSSNDIAFRIAARAEHACALSVLVDELSRVVGRVVSEEEVLIWLALGAESRREGRPLLRPVIHAFVRGLSGAVVTFADARPRLWLSRAEALADRDAAGLRKLDVTTCTTCGQHYFVHFAADFSFVGKQPMGGSAAESTAYWSPLDQARGGKRLVLTTALIGGEEEIDPGEAIDGDEATAPKRTRFVHMCRVCGALHREAGSRCLECRRSGELVQLLVVQQRETAEGYLNRCIACGALGRKIGSNYREPARPLRAITVSDIHVLAQNMLHEQQAGERKRLIIFADNRQDAAFQAGWMQDHARRYRLRALIYERIEEEACSIGDLVAWLDRRLDIDEELSRSLLIEVWEATRKEFAGKQHGEDRRFFLRVQVLREVTSGLRQRIGLEPWGRLRVRYLGLEPTLPFVREWAQVAGCTPEAMVEAVASLLDISRRSAALYDRDHGVFTRWWSESQREVLQGYVQASASGPRALLCERTPEHAKRISQWISTRGQTRAVGLAKRWGIEDERVRDFLEGLWTLLTDELQLLVPVTLLNHLGRPLTGCDDAHQVDADRIVLEAAKGLFRCGTCRRTQLRAGPHDRCIQWRCAGVVKPIQEDPDDYDLRVLDERFTLVRAREHSAQVPGSEREELERQFKAPGERVNTLVATPTLELGVDIGSLDAVLMRNVPPVAANYWQRVGRAGRRHRMAVNLTYAGAKAHDRAYFDDPLKLLGGKIDPPRFNLRNIPMVRKHVHATVISELHQLARPQRGLAESEREAITAALARAFPKHIRGYLFTETGDVLRSRFDLSPLERVLDHRHAELCEHVVAVFAGCWPIADREVVTLERIRQYLRELIGQLREVIDRLTRRRDWALGQLRLFDTLRERKGTLDPAEESTRARCDRMVKRLKGMSRRRRGDAEGHDDTLTYSVLAAEGFLPGYGLDVGTVMAYHQAPRGIDSGDFQIRRAKSLALREYVPGNSIYANGHRFFPRFFHLEALEQGGGIEPLAFRVDVVNEAVTEVNGASDSVGTTRSFDLLAVPICDVDLPHQSHIADDEDYRFQLPVAIHGYELAEHGEGQAYRWGARLVELREQVRLRLVNVGPRRLVGDGEPKFGYPICLICGQSRSPFSAKEDLDAFSELHRERCGRAVRPVGFHTEEIVDALRLADCASRREAHSLAEALRMGAAEVLAMDRDDLQILVIGQTGREQVDLLLFDPMSGGSGLLEQMVQRWEEVVTKAERLCAECPSRCDVACVDCLQHYRNAWAHEHLDRNVVVEVVAREGKALSFAHHIEERRGSVVTKAPTRELGEADFDAMLSRAGLAPQRGHAIDLGLPLGRTTPDFFFADPHERTEGMCIYVEGRWSDHEAQQHARQVRRELEARQFDVIELPATKLAEREAMRTIMTRVARFVGGRERGQAIREDDSWFDAPPVEAEDGWSALLRLLEPVWRGLFERLRERGVPAPDDADWDLPIEGRVGEQRAIAVWRPGERWVALIDEPLAGGDLERVKLVEPGADPAEVADWLLARLDGGAA